MALARSKIHVQAENIAMQQQRVQGIRFSPGVRANEGTRSRSGACCFHEGKNMVVARGHADFTRPIGFFFCVMLGVGVLPPPVAMILF
jgi:hypothetical protein